MQLAAALRAGAAELPAIARQAETVLCRMLLCWAGSGAGPSLPFKPEPGTLQLSEQAMSCRAVSVHAAKIRLHRLSRSRMLEHRCGNLIIQAASLTIAFQQAQEVAEGLAAPLPCMLS